MALINTTSSKEDSFLRVTPFPFTDETKVTSGQNTVILRVAFKKGCINKPTSNLKNILNTKLCTCKF